MKRLCLILSLIVLAALCLSGCTPQMDEIGKQRLAYMQASDSYQATAKILVAYRKAEKIDDKEWADIKVWDDLVFGGLVSWQEALATGQSTTKAAQTVNAALRELLLKRLEMQGG